MTYPVIITGMGAVTAPTYSLSMDELIADALDRALASASLDLDALDGIIASGNDGDEGVLSPLMCAEAAGAAGREYLYMTGGYCQAVSAAAAIVASGLSAQVGVVGWGTGGPVVDQNEVMSADPFFLRPVGATPARLRRLRARAMGQDHGTDGHPPAADGRQDAAVSLILTNGARISRGVALTNWRSGFHPYLPAPEDLDPIAWREQILPSPGTAYDLSGVSASDHPGLSSWMKSAVSLITCITEIKARTTARPVWFIEEVGPLGQGMTALAMEGSP